MATITIGKEPLTARRVERFWRQVDKSDPRGCWTFRTVGANGYGAFRMKSNHRVTSVGAHRVAWMATNGPIPSEVLVCHRCDNPPCCNPAHLFVGTKADNTRDMISKGRRAVRGSEPGRPAKYATLHRGRWLAQFSVGKRCFYAGSFNTQKEATAASVALREKMGLSGNVP
jgi:hypothetical protein